MLVDFCSPGELPISADAVIVVGSGAAGMALALALGDRGRPVVLLESGPDTSVGPTDPVATAADALNVGVIEGLPFGLTAARARGLGGTTRLWHGQCKRLNDIDLADRDWIPHSGWPLPASELDRYYPAAEAFFKVVGEEDTADRWAGFSRLPPLPWNPARLLDDATEYAPERHLAKVYGSRLRPHRSITTVVNATVSRVLVDAGRVAGVEVLGPDRRARTLKSRCVVLAAGTVENARVLQLSDPDGIGLGEGRAHTGRYLQTHPVIRTALIEPYDYRKLQDRYTIVRHDGRQLFPKLRLAPAAQERHHLMNACAALLFTHDDAAFAATRRLGRALLERRRPPSLAKDLQLALPQAGPVARDLFRRRVRGLSTGARPTAVAVEVWLEQQPDVESRLDLADTVDALGLRQARVRWRVGEPEIRTSRVMTRWLAEDLTRLGLARTVELPAMWDDDAWRAGVRDGAHGSGTTRMSRHASTGVVDADLKVHGVDGLHVVGGSVFPTAGYANPTLAIVALALRLADHVHQRPALSVSRLPDRRRRRRATRAAPSKTAADSGRFASGLVS